RISSTLVVQGLNTQLPSINEHLINFLQRTIRMDHQIDRLRLIDVLLSLRCLYDDSALVDLSKRLEHVLLKSIQERKMLNGTTCFQNGTPCLIIILSISLKNLGEGRI